MWLRGRVTIVGLVKFFLKVIVALWIVQLILGVGGLILWFSLAWFVNILWS